MCDELCSLQFTMLRTSECNTNSMNSIHIKCVILYICYFDVCARAIMKCTNMYWCSWMTWSELIRLRSDFLIMVLNFVESNYNKYFGVVFFLTLSLTMCSNFTVTIRYSVTAISLKMRFSKNYICKKRHYMHAVVVIFFFS